MQEISHLETTATANRILNWILVGFLLIAFRLWHLAVIQHEERVEASQKPLKKVVIEPANRGTIRDCFNIPLATNKIRYNVAIVYSQIRQAVPALVWEGKEKKFKRKAYINEFARMLSRELSLPTDHLEDLIHAKAAFYNHLPFVIKEDVTEKEYYRLKVLEKDWPGLLAVQTAKRHYPKGKVGADIIGYMGSISREEYERIFQEIKNLESFIAQWEAGEEIALPEGYEDIEEVQNCLQRLIDQSYAVQDFIGKTGVEQRFESELRGVQGKKYFYSDAKGNFIRPVEGPVNKATPGKRILLTMSSELQEYAEGLLAYHDVPRSARVSGIGDNLQASLGKMAPWIKGGAIVVMEPTTGNIVAMASYPRFEPNDFLPGKTKNNENIARWFETDNHIAAIWEGQTPLQRERFEVNGGYFYEEELPLSWETYLERILPKESHARVGLARIARVGDAILLQQSVRELSNLCGSISVSSLINVLYASPPHITCGSSLPIQELERIEELLLSKKVENYKKTLDCYMEGVNFNYDKILLLDLSRLLIDNQKVSKGLWKVISEEFLSERKKLATLFFSLKKEMRERARRIFHEHYFKSWRLVNEQAFLKKVRENEKARKVLYAAPYSDCLDKKERELFDVFFKEHEWQFYLLFLGVKTANLSTEFKPYMDDILKQKTEEENRFQLLQDRLATIPAFLAEEYLRTFRPYNELSQPLWGRYSGLRQQGGKQLERHLAAAFYPRYGFGFSRSYAFRQAATQGSLFKLVTAYTALAQRYEEQEGKGDLNPLIMTDDIIQKRGITYLGYDDKGEMIPRLYKGGRLIKSHKGGLGRLDLIKALEVSSNPYFSLLASDYLKNPDDLAQSARLFSYGSRTGIDLPAEIGGHVPEDLSFNRSGLYAMAVGQHTLVVTPLQTAQMLSTLANGGALYKPNIIKALVDEEGWTAIPKNLQRQIFLPDRVREMLLKGMSLASLHMRQPPAEDDSDYSLKGKLIGKSSTAESSETLNLDLSLGTKRYNHVWYGGILFNEEEKPDLVIVVYLKYGSWGKEAAPLAEKIAKKWLQIRTGSTSMKNREGISID